MRTFRYALAGPTAVLFLWWVVTALKMIDPLFLPSPSRTLDALLGLFASGSILPDLKWTVIRWIAGLVVGIALGVPLGLVMGSSRKIYDSLEMVIDFSRSVPVMTLFPLSLVLFGIGDRSKIALAAWASLLYVVINTVYGVRHVQEARLMMARSLGATTFQRFAKVILPDALPEILVGVRLSLSMSLVIVVASEMIMGTNVGLGKRIFDAGLVYQIPEMYGSIILAGLLGYLSNKLFVVFENRTVHWANR